MTTRIEIFPCRRLPGFIALIWRNGQIFQLIHALGWGAAQDAAQAWNASHRGME